VLCETTRSTVENQRYEVAVLPWGATEAHNYHLPYGTDNYETEAVALEAGRIAWEGGARVIVLPGIPYGVNTGQLDIPLTINLNPSTQLQVLRDIADSLVRSGVERLVVVNGHGGNEHKALIRELQGSHKLLIALVNWWSIESGKDYFDDPGDHAGELETSMMQHIAPELVLPLERAGNGNARSARLAALKEGWAWVPRRWTQVTQDTGVGDPRAATPVKGQRFFEVVTNKLAAFLIGFSNADPAALYE